MPLFARPRIKRGSVLLACAAVFLAMLGPAADFAEGRPGRSYSSGRSSSSSRSFSSRSSSRSSYSGSSSRGRSYSSGSSSRSSSPFGSSSRPSSPSSSSSSRSRSGGFGGFDSDAGSAQRRSQSRESYTSRSSPRTGDRWSTDSTSPSGPSTRRDTPPWPTGQKYDSSAAAAQRRAESKAAYTKGQEPSSTYRDNAGNTRPIDRSNPSVGQLRRNLDRNTWQNRYTRQRNFATRYNLSPAPTLGYSDPFSNLFWTWLLVQSLDTRANFAYHQRSSMDEARYRELLSKDERLEAKVKELEEKKVPVDPTQLPEGIDPDLVYSDEYVDAVYNPQPEASASRPTPTTSSTRSPFKPVLVLLFLAFLVWLIFFKRWGATPEPRKKRTDPAQDAERR